MKTLLLILLASIAAIIAGCKTADSPFHDWKPPGMMNQVTHEKGNA